MIFIRETLPNGQDQLGTFSFIRLDARRNIQRLKSDAEYHMRARSWYGYRMYKAAHLRDNWTVIHETINPEAVK